ncbi:hypothetical protein KC207_07575 [Phycicoccus sp. BSK3Z-2]|uniref:Peptidase MA-like domain-containing protein n=1 Tax=Phycicoccus avicenniae TaxID=2828860 RepID=A0A941D8P9_9MICO|nr:hypothetical protein [Phycicoccus avicenniae]MBR7743148.1 hypothetical protein [Phycicoccus avicenniae]
MTSRDRRRAVGLVVAATVALGGCTAADEPDAGASGSTASTTPSGDAGDTSSDRASEAATAVSDVLRTRDRATLAGDRAAFAATVAHPDGATAGADDGGSDGDGDADHDEGSRQLAAFDAAGRLGLSRLEHDVVAPVDDPAAVDVTLRYRVDGIDRGDRTATVRYRVVEQDGRWLVAAQQPVAPGAAPPWLAMPDLAVRRSDHAVVVGTADTPALAAAARTVDDVLPRLARQWQRTPGRTLVLLPATPAEADALTGAPSGAPGTVAALTDGPLDDTGRATGDRVVLDPDAQARLTAVGRDVVLAHELVHVAVRATVPGTPPLWLSEGYADHVGYGRADLPQRTLAAPLLDAVRAGTGPDAIPTADALDPQAGPIETGYLAAWQVAETVVDLAGEEGLRALVRACASTDGEAAAEETCDGAMPRVLGTDRDGLTRRWLERLDRLAR